MVASLGMFTPFPAPKVQLTSNVTLSAVAGICSLLSVSGIDVLVTPPVIGNESDVDSVLPDRRQLPIIPNGFSPEPAPAMYDNSTVLPANTVLFISLL